jgi:hypothetical protein
LGGVVRRRGYLLSKFVNIVRATGQLVSCPDDETGTAVPDIKATMLRIIDDHARTAAEGFRWRMIHGALSSSNMEMSGAMLDLPTQSTQPRTAPIRCLEYAESVFGTEQVERAAKLRIVYHALVRNTHEPERSRCNVTAIKFAEEMTAAYQRHLQVKLLSATGLKTEVAERIQSDRPELARRFAELILNMAGLKNHGTICAWRSEVDRVSVLDVFNLLRCFPARFFASANADKTETILDHLRPIFRGSGSHTGQKRKVKLLAAEFGLVYGEVMKVSAEYADQYYGDRESMRASIVARAAFENDPLESLYRKRLRRELRDVVTSYRATGRTQIVRKAIDRLLTTSLRSVDRLLTQGNSQRLGGGVELQMRTIDGIQYSIRAWNDKTQTRRLHISVPAVSDGDNYLTAIPKFRRLTKRQVGNLRYRFTTDNWLTFAEARASLMDNGPDRLTIDFANLHSSVLVGRLKGAFYLCGASSRGWADRSPYLKGYVFAIPDEQELMKF